MNQRLLELAEVVEGYEEFNQFDNDHCTITLAEQMIEKETGEDIIFGGIHRVAEYFGLFYGEVDALFVGDFGELNIGMENCEDMDDVTREQAAEALRRLAARE
jgi:hypothetical protein